MDQTAPTKAYVYTELPEGSYTSVTDYARLNGKSRQAVLMSIRRGAFKDEAFRVGQIWVIKIKEDDEK